MLCYICVCRGGGSGGGVLYVCMKTDGGDRVHTGKGDLRRPE